MNRITAIQNTNTLGHGIAPGVISVRDKVSAFSWPRVLKDTKMKVSQKQMLAMQLAKHLPRTLAQIPAAEAFCAEYNIDLDKFIAEGIESDVRNTLEDEANMHHHQTENRVKVKKPSIFTGVECVGAASLINNAARMTQDMTVTVTFKITPATFRQLLEGAVESGAGLDQLVEVALNRLVQDKPAFTLPKLRNS